MMAEEQAFGVLEKKNFDLEFSRGIGFSRIAKIFPQICGNFCGLAISENSKPFLWGGKIATGEFLKNAISYLDSFFGCCWNRKNLTRKFGRTLLGRRKESLRAAGLAPLVFL